MWSNLLSPSSWSMAQGHIPAAQQSIHRWW